MKVGLALVSFVTLSSIAASSPLGTQPSCNSSKKLIEWGWDSPTSEYFRQNSTQFQGTPFDGIVINPTNNAGTKIVWNMWGTMKFSVHELDFMVRDLLAVELQQITDRFLRANVTPGNVDWFDDEAFGVVVNNFKIIARAAKLAKCKGIVFDLEQYEFELFNYNKIARNTSSLESYKSKVRERGRQLVDVVSSEYPEMVVIFPWMNAAYKSGPDRYKLLPPFLDGFIEGAPHSMQLIDGTEGAYLAKTEEHFKRLYLDAKIALPKYSSNPTLYAEKTKVGFGIRLDSTTSQFPLWDLANNNHNYFTPIIFQEAVFQAMIQSDRYVWIYSERVDWWKERDKLGAYDEAIRNAQARLSTTCSNGAK